MILINSTTYKELNKFFERYKLPKLIQEKICCLNGSLTIKGFDMQLKSFPREHQGNIQEQKFTPVNSTKHLREKNIIKAHMFPMYTTVPRYKESILVSLVDKIVAIYEFSHKFKIKFRWRRII